MILSNYKFFQALFSFDANSLKSQIEGLMGVPVTISAVEDVLGQLAAIKEMGLPADIEGSNFFEITLYPQRGKFGYDSRHPERHERKPRFDLILAIGNDQEVASKTQKSRFSLILRETEWQISPSSLLDGVRR